MKGLFVRLGVLALALIALALPAAANTVDGGGKTLSKTDMTFESGKLSTGGESSNKYVFHFYCTPVGIKDIHITMENGDGKEVGSGSSISAVDVKVNNQSKGGGSASGSKDSVDCNVNASSDFDVEITASSDLGNVRFNISFSTKDTNNIGYLWLDQFDAGHRSLLARPVVGTATGIVIPLKNVGTEPLTFGRFELVGAGDVLIMSVAAEGFTVEIEPGARAFALRGGALPANQTLEVLVRTSVETNLRGAVLGFFDQN